MMVSPTKEASNIYRIGTWNVRTLRTREEEVIREMACYNIDFLGLGEMGYGNGIAPGLCGVTGEMLKAGGGVVVEWLHKIMDLAWRSESVLMDWWRALIVPIRKKGSRTQCENYRGISLLSIPGKVYASVLEKGMRTITEGKVLEEQGAFRRGRSCVDRLFTVRQLGEKIIEKNKRMLMVCVDLAKAYDRVDRELLWRVLKAYGVNGELIRAMRSLYGDGKACVRDQGQKLDWFEVGQGVTQGGKEP